MFCPNESAGPDLGVGGVRASGGRRGCGSLRSGSTVVHGRPCCPVVGAAASAARGASSALAAGSAFLKSAAAPSGGPTPRPAAPPRTGALFTPSTSPLPAAAAPRPSGIPRCAQPLEQSTAARTGLRCNPVRQHSVPPPAATASFPWWWPPTFLRWRPPPTPAEARAPLAASRLPHCPQEPRRHQQSPPTASCRSPPTSAEPLSLLLPPSPPQTLSDRGSIHDSPPSGVGTRPCPLPGPTAGPPTTMTVAFRPRSTSRAAPPAARSQPPPAPFPAPAPAARPPRPLSRCSDVVGGKLQAAREGDGVSSWQPQGGSVRGEARGERAITGRGRWRSVPCCHQGAAASC